MTAPLLRLQFAAHFFNNLPSLQKIVLWFAASAVMLSIPVSDKLQCVLKLLTQKLYRDGIQWYGEFTVTNTKVMYGGRNYFNYISINKNLAITVFIPENASLLDGCRGPYSLFYSLSSSSLSLSCFLCLAASARQGSNNVGSNHWCYFLFSSLALPGQSTTIIFYPILCFEVCCGREELVTQHFWISNVLWLVS